MRSVAGDAQQYLRNWWEVCLNSISKLLLGSKNAWGVNAGEYWTQAETTIHSSQQYLWTSVFQNKYLSIELCTTAVINLCSNLLSPQHSLSQWHIISSISCLQLFLLHLSISFLWSSRNCQRAVCWDSKSLWSTLIEQTVKEACQRLGCYQAGQTLPQGLA